MNFDTLIGNDDIKDTLCNYIKRDSILHSYAFIGQDGIGKEKFAEEFAKEILCLSDIKKGDNSCESCIKFNSSNHPDFIKVEPDGNYIKIAQIRKMQENIYQKPILSNKKVFIINDADLMTEEAQNSLLKILEEPPIYVIIILIVSNESLLLNTIKSRCSKIYFANISNIQIKNYINDNKLIENVTENLIDMCNGSIGKLLNIKENIEEYKNTENLINSIMNNTYKSIIDVNKNSSILYKSKDNIINLLEYMIVIVFNLIKKEKIENSNQTFKYFSIIETVENTKRKVNSNSNYDMCIDELLFKISSIMSIDC